MGAQSIADVSFVLPSIKEVFAVLLLQAGFNSALVVIGTTLLGVAAGTIGTFSLLRKRALMGDALAHSALPGLAMAFILGSQIGIGGRTLWLLLLGATVSGVLGVVCVQLLSRYSRLKEDAAIGAVLSCFFGAGIVLLSIIQSLGTGEEGGLHHFIFGQTAAMNRSDVWLMLLAASAAILTSVLLFKEFRVVSFDQDFADAEGWPVSAIDLLMMSLIVLITVIGLQAVGLLLIVAMLIIPAAAARFWTEKLQAMVCASALIGGLSGYLGSAASALLPRLPAGAVIVLVAGVIFLLSFFFAPARGIVFRQLARWKMSLRISEDHLLREIYEQCELKDPDGSALKEWFDLSRLKLTKQWSPLFRFYFLRHLRSQGALESKVEQGSTWIRLLPEGILQAKVKVRNHRLWEEYLSSQTGLPISHVDYSADLVEHVLSPQLVAELEQSLEGRLPVVEPPRSIHPLQGET